MEKLAYAPLEVIGDVFSGEDPYSSIREYQTQKTIGDSLSFIGIIIAIIGVPIALFGLINNEKQSIQQIMNQSQPIQQNSQYYYSKPAQQQGNQHMKYCTECGFVNRQDAKFCTECGKKI